MSLAVGIGDALGTDYFRLKEQATPQQLEYLARTRDFVQSEVQPVINDYWERAEFPWPLIEKLARSGSWATASRDPVAPRSTRCRRA
jgi:glutaryl-CoA dehydrogenase